MTELHHFHPARKGSGSLRPFPIYPLYTQTVILSLDKPADCFLFRPRKRLEKRRKRSHINASNASVIRTSRVSQTSPQTPPPYFYQWVSHGKKLSWHNRLQNAPRLFSLVKVSTPSALEERLHTRAHTAKQGCFGWGRYHYPQTVLRGSETLRGRDLKRQTLPLLGLGRGRSRSTQRAFGTAMRLCASLFRGVAAPQGCATLFSICPCCISCARRTGFLRVRGGGGITTLGVLRILSKRPVPICQND